MIIHYNFKCPNCGQEHLDLTEGTMCFCDDSIFQIYKCEECNTLKDLSQHKSHTSYIPVSTHNEAMFSGTWTSMAL